MVFGSLHFTIGYVFFWIPCWNFFWCGSNLAQRLTCCKVRTLPCVRQPSGTWGWLNRSMWGSGDEKLLMIVPIIIIFFLLLLFLLVKYHSVILIIITIIAVAIILYSDDDDDDDDDDDINSSGVSVRPGWLQRRTPWVSGHLGSLWEMGHFWDAANYFIRKLVGIYFSIFFYGIAIYAIRQYVQYVHDLRCPILAPKVWMISVLHLPRTLQY